MTSKGSTCMTAGGARAAGRTSRICSTAPCSSYASRSCFRQRLRVDDEARAASSWGLTASGRFCFLTLRCIRKAPLFPISAPFGPKCTPCATLALLQGPALPEALEGLFGRYPEVLRVETLQKGRGYAEMARLALLLLFHASVSGLSKAARPRFLNYAPGSRDQAGPG